jgi:hypothetical protein
MRRRTAAYLLQHHISAAPLGELRTSTRDARRVLWIAAYEVLNIPQALWQWLCARVVPKAEAC